MNIEIKDRKPEIEQARMGLAMVRISLDYESVDLLLRTLKKVNEMKGLFSIDDASHIQFVWRNEWLTYFEMNKRDKNE